MRKLRVLVTGANGFIGSALAAHLLELGHHVVAAVRSHASKLPAGCEQVAGLELSAQTDWSAVLDNIDVVIHLAARVHVMREHAAHPLQAFRDINTAGTIRLAAQAAESGVQRFIFLSSIGVNGANSGAQPFSEASTPAPHSDYAISKLEAEEGIGIVCAASQMEYVILRPPMVYGARAPGNFASLLGIVERGLPLPLGSVRNRRSMIHVDNLVHMIALCLSDARARNQLFLIADSAPISTPELLRLLAKGMGRRSRLLPCPPKLLQQLAALAGRRKTYDQLCGSLHIDPSKFITMLAWQPATSIQDGLVATAAQYISDEHSSS